MKKKPTNKSKKWFIKIRGSYLPNNIFGWLLYIPYITFLILVLVAAITTQDSVSKVFFMIFPQWVAAGVVMTWVATLKS